MSIGREDYQERKEARVERYEERAARAQAESDAASKAAHDILSHIPPGQPILVGHHSERRHRRDLEKSDRNMRKSIEAGEKAAYYAGRAASAASNTAISSDDPNALDKLEKKLAALQAAQEWDKGLNAYYRKHKTVKGYEGISDEGAAKIDAQLAEQDAGPYSTGRHLPIPSWQLSKMRRYVKRAAKGIAVVKDVEGVPTLRYVFDIADTGNADGKYYLYSWHIDDEFVPVVSATLEQYFLVPADDRGLAVQLASIAANLAAKYWDIYKDTLPNAIKGSTLRKKNRAYKKAFLDAATASITYTLLARCGLEPDQLFDSEDFAHVYECDTQESVQALGDAFSQCSEMVLRTIEHNIKQYLRDKQSGQDVRPASPSLEPGTPAAA